MTGRTEANLTRQRPATSRERWLYSARFADKQGATQAYGRAVGMAVSSTSIAACSSGNAARADIDFDQHVDLRASLLRRIRQKRDGLGLIDADAHADLTRQVRQARDLARADDLVGNDHIADAAADKRLRLGHLLQHTPTDPKAICRAAMTDDLHGGCRHCESGNLPIGHRCLLCCTAG
jgi:hypothetical protein